VLSEKPLGLILGVRFEFISGFSFWIFSPIFLLPLSIFPLFFLFSPSFFNLYYLWSICHNFQVQGVNIIWYKKEDEMMIRRRKKALPLKRGNRTKYL